MAISQAVISFDLSEMGGSPLLPGWTRLRAFTNIPSQTIIDTSSGDTYLGDTAVDVPADGLGSITVPIPGGTSNPASWQTSFQVTYRLASNSGAEAVVTYGPYTITGDAALGSLVQQQAIPPDYAGELVAQMEAIRDDVVDISGISTSDALVAALVNTGGGPLTQSALSATFVAHENVLKHGAVANGTTDDTAAIQAAINALPLNTPDTGVLSPKGFANGGTVYLPRGRYVVSGTITLTRGVRIVGEGREATQIISKTAGSVFSYPDAGRYVQDEIAFEHLSIWQDASVTATSGAAIAVGFGPASVQSTKLVCKNVYIEGTYVGVRHEAGVGSVFQQIDTSKCVSHGFDIRRTDGTNTVTTTSTAFIGCYSNQNGGDGFHVTGGAYMQWVACASDSNAGYGYYFDLTAGAAVKGGAEENALGGAYLKDTSGMELSLNVVHLVGPTGRHAITLNNAANTGIQGGVWASGAAFTGYGVHLEATARKVVYNGPVLTGGYATRKTDQTAHFLDLGATGGLVGDTNNWAIGPTTGATDPLAVFQVGGLADTDSDAGLKANVTHTGAGAARNMAAYIQALTANTAVTYPLLVGIYLPSASKGAASTVTRTAGIYLVQSSTGGTANAMLMLDSGSTGTVPAGNWAIYSSSTLDSVLFGPLRMGSDTGPKWQSGSGSPEGVVSAPVGSLYSRTNGGAATSLYVKESGTGNTGWVAK